MKIAFCHNFYRYPGGEDRVYFDESDMMDDHGHEVLRFTRHHDELNNLSNFSLAKKSIWNSENFHRLSSRLKDFKPDIVHFENTFPLISPAGYKAAKNAGAAVIQTLHNYRWICPNANLVYRGEICETCVKKTVALPAISRRCYRNSRSASAAVVAMNAYHKFRGTLPRLVDRFIALTEFCKSKFIEGGFLESQLVVKPNFVSSPPSEIRPMDQRKPRVCFVGRLVKEKGIETLLGAWTSHELPLELHIIGDGPLKGLVTEYADHHESIHYHRQMEHHSVLNFVGESMLQVVPSKYYEPFGLVVVEAFATGTPVITANLGSLAELVTDKETGILFEAGNPADLAAKMDLLASDEGLRRRLSENGRNEFNLKYTRKRNYELLLNIYESALGSTTEQQA